MTWTKCNPDDPSTYPSTYPTASKRVLVTIDPRPGQSSSRPFIDFARWRPGQYPYWESGQNWEPNCVPCWQPLPPLPGEEGEQPKDEELARLLRGIDGVITFARDAWGGNDGAEGDAVRRLCDVAEAARRSLPDPRREEAERLFTELCAVNAELDARLDSVATAETLLKEACGLLDDAQYSDLDRPQATNINAAIEDWKKRYHARSKP